MLEPPIEPIFESLKDFQIDLECTRKFNQDNNNSDGYHNQFESTVKTFLNNYIEKNGDDVLSERKHSDAN